MIVSSTLQNSMPTLKKNQFSSAGACVTPAIGINTLPTIGMNQAGLECWISKPW